MQSDPRPKVSFGPSVARPKGSQLEASWPIIFSLFCVTLFGALVSLGPWFIEPLELFKLPDIITMQLERKT